MSKNSFSPLQARRLERGRSLTAPDAGQIAAAAVPADISENVPPQCPSTYASLLTDCTLVYGPLPRFDTKKAERPKAFRKKVYFRSQSGICLACS